MAKSAAANSAKGEAYKTDLAYIHDAGFGGFARHGGQVLCELLREQGATSGLVVELGCGSGIASQIVSEAGYDLLGYDISPAMVELARRRAPRAQFRVESFLDAPLPECTAVVAIGEIFNYLFDSRNASARLERLFRRVYQALVPGGVLLFDAALVGREPQGRRRHFTEGDDWACLYEAEEDRQRKTLERRITSFRKVGKAYRRDAEVHRLRLYERSELLASLRAAGFRARTLKSYGNFAFPPGFLAFAARKAR